jgi:hypothetical protein
VTENLKIPTHEEVASVLDQSHPGIAKMIRESNPETNCWSDLIIRAQHDFDPHDVATAFRRLSMKGWGKHIVLTWCPLTKPLWKQYQKAQESVDEFSKLEKKEKKVKARTVHGLVAMMRDLWNQTRELWMKNWSLKSENDPAFLNMIVLYLEQLSEENSDAASNG